MILPRYINFNKFYYNNKILETYLFGIKIFFYTKYNIGMDCLYINTLF